MTPKRILGGILVVSVSAGLGGFVTGQLTDSAKDAIVDPIGTASPTTAVVRVDTIQSVIVLSGVIVPKPALPLPATASGSVMSIRVNVGESVKQKDPVVVVARPTGLQAEIVSPVDGTVTSVVVATGELVKQGQTVATVAPARYLASATVPPDLLYRLYAPPLSIKTQIDKGPGPFDCPLIALGIKTDTAVDPLNAPVELTCDVPATVRAFAGVRVRLGVTTGRVDRALTLPVEAVAGTADSGAVTLILPNGERVERSVRLGLTDGLRVQILEGLSAGDVVLNPPAVDPELAPQPSP